MIKRKHKLFLFLLIWVLLLSYLCTSLILYRQNTLYNNKQWDSTKMSLKLGVLGSHAYYLTRNALAKNHLNLGAWHGYHELIYKDPVNPKSVEFDFYMKEPSEFSFIFNKDEEGYAGIRINTHDQEEKNEIFISNEIGEFIYKKKLEVDNIEYEKWNNFRVDFLKNSFTMYVNGEKSDSYELKLREKQRIGFRGGRQKVLIDNVVISQFSSTDIREDFRNTEKLIPIFLVFLLLFFGPLIITFFSGKQSHFFNFVLVLLVLTTIVIGIYFFEYFFWSERYINNPDKIDWKEFENKMKIEYDPDLVEGLDSLDNKRNEVKRILFIGSSQTWGSGASNNDKTFVKVFEDLINSDSEKYECINPGISNSNSTTLLRHYNSSWINLEPDIVVINLGNNDESQGDFYNNLERFVILNNKENIETVFILEPNSYNNSEHIVEQHPVMREVSDKYNITMIDMHSYLLERYDTGFLWWDFVHLTDYGQQLFAEKLYREVI